MTDILKMYNVSVDQFSNLLTAIAKPETKPKVEVNPEPKTETKNYFTVDNILDFIEKISKNENPEMKEISNKLFSGDCKEINDLLNGFVTVRVVKPEEKKQESSPENQAPSFTEFDLDSDIINRVRNSSPVFFESQDKN